MLDDGAVGRGTVRGIGVREYRRPALRESGERGCAMCVDWTRAVQSAKRREPPGEGAKKEPNLLCVCRISGRELSNLCSLSGTWQPHCTLETLLKPLSIFISGTRRVVRGPHTPHTVHCPQSAQAQEATVKLINYLAGRPVEARAGRTSVAHEFPCISVALSLDFGNKQGMWVCQPSRAVSLLIAPGGPASSPASPATTNAAAAAT